MPERYEEIIEGESYRRMAPDARHEQICTFLHERIAETLEGISHTQLLPRRSILQLSPGTLIRPDIALVTAANKRPWLAAEIISSDDHRIDTVVKKTTYEDAKIPRLWMIDPRYDNVEVYNGNPFGLALQKILAAHDILQEKLLPELNISIQELFARK